MSSLINGDQSRVIDSVEALKAEVHDEGEFDCVEVLVTRAEAFNGPDAVKWMEADDKERLTLEAMKCWRPMTDADLGLVKEVIPSAVIYTRKRCGKFKARLVALGNLQSVDSVGEIYSPTVSHIANRSLVIHSAAEGLHVSGFDLTAAFINAVFSEEEHVHMRLPKHWSSDKKRGDVVSLLKCIYGLKQAPRRWFDTYSAYLKRQG